MWLCFSLFMTLGITKRVKPFFVTPHCEIWLRQKLQLSYSSRLRNWGHDAMWSDELYLYSGACLFWSRCLFKSSPIFHRSWWKLILEVVRDVGTFNFGELTISAQLTAGEWNEFQLCMLFWKHKCRAGRLYSSKSLFVAALMLFSGATRTPREGRTLSAHYCY